MAEGQELQLKLLLLGGAETGKTSILTRFSEDKFNEEYIRTIGELTFPFLVPNAVDIPSIYPASGSDTTYSIYDGTGNTHARAIYIRIVTSTYSTTTLSYTPSSQKHIESICSRDFAGASIDTLNYVECPWC